MILHTFQLRAIDALREGYRLGKRAPVLISATGSGKTVMGASCVAGHIAKGGTVVWYAHRRELLTQAADTLHRFGLDVGIFGEGAHHTVQVMSTQAALSRGEVQKCSLAVIDECHHAAAEDWTAIPQAHKDSGSLLLGLTATPERGDGKGLGPLFDHLVVAAQIKHLVLMGHLVPCDLIRPSRRVPKGKIAQHPLKAYREYGHGRQNVVFAPNLKSAREWCADFAAGGIPTAVVWGTMPAEERDAILEAYRVKRLRCLINVFVLTEGWDMPDLGVVTIARSCGSAGMYIQMCGRGARPAPGKSKYTVLDLRGVSYELGRPDDDREYSLDGIGISKGTGEGIGERLCRACKRPILADICENCGKDNGQAVPGDAGVELEAWKVAIRKDDDGQRVARLRRWISEARGRGHKWQSAIHKFRGVYGESPTQSVLAAAMARVS